MASQSGNAWAQMKARGQQQQIVDEGKVAIPLKGPVMVHRPTSSRKSSGLDYDDELALPMPKPRHVAAEEHNISIQDVRPNLRRVLSITKTRSVTERARTDNISDELKEKTGNSEKKKSRVAALKSKLSLKDMIQEFRKENAKTESAADSSGRHPPCACSHGFGEEKLYVPKARQLGVYPSSAPPFPVRDVSFGEISQASTESCDVGNSKTNDKVPNDEGLSPGLVASKDNDVQTPKARKAETNIQLDTILLVGPSSEGFADELKNSEQSHIMKKQPSIQSLTTQRDPEFPSTASKDSVHASEDDVGGLASFPSDCDNKDIAVTATQPSVSNHDLHGASNGGTGSNITSATGQTSLPSFFPPQTGLPFAAMPAVLDPSTQQYQPNPCDESQHQTFFDGTTYGGYAPRPPPADYFNTANLEMQLKMNMEMIHVHLNNSVHRVCSSLENSNNWSTDQILKQTDDIADILRLINARTAGHNGTVSDLHRTLTHIQCQIAAIEVQVNGMEERIMKFMSNQINKLRRDINAPRESLRRAVASQLAQDPRTMDAGLQEPPNTANLTEENEILLFKKKQRHGKREEAGWLRSTENRMGEQKKGSETESGGRSLAQGNAQTPFQKIQHSPTSVHSSSLEQRKYGGRPQLQVRNGMRNNPSQESSGSPMPKTSKASHQTGNRLVPEDDQSSISEATQTLSIGDKPINECTKTPSKKGMFGFRRRHDGENQTGNRLIRTPRRNKENRSLKEPSSLHSMASVPSVVASAIQMKAMVTSSPSSIHPALRDDRQEQAILDRQRIDGLLHSHTSNYLAISARESTQMSGLKYFQSHRDMGNVTPMTSHPPPGSFVIASNAASQGKLNHNGWPAPNLLPPSLQVCVPIPFREPAANTPDLEKCCNDIPLGSDRYDSGAW